MCDCSRRYHTDYYTTVCQDCGKERPIGGLNPETTCNMGGSLDRSYSRKERWNGLIKKLTGFHNGPLVYDPAWAYLEKHKPFQHPRDIIACL